MNVETVPKINKRQVIDITTFSDLIDAEENLKIPILYFETSHGKETIFVIPTNDYYYL